MSQYNYFTDAEIAGLQMPLPAMLDMARGYLGQPIDLTFTTGGQHCPNSAHYKGLAVDIGLGQFDEGAIRDAYRYGLVFALLRAGFQRVEIAPAHIHVDIGTLPDYQTPLLWIGADQ